MWRSRGKVYSSWASSTWSQAIAVRAPRAKMSRISSVRSTTFRSVAFSRLRTWAALRSTSMTMTSALSSRQSSVSSCTLPPPRKVAGSGARRCWTHSPTTTAPAVRASCPSSASDSRVNEASPIEAPTSTTRSRATASSVRFSSTCTSASPLFSWEFGYSFLLLCHVLRGGSSAIGL